jgi:hypothetical protein
MKAFRRLLEVMHFQFSYPKWNTKERIYKRQRAVHIHKLRKIKNK